MKGKMTGSRKLVKDDREKKGRKPLPVVVAGRGLRGAN
jgi:hypothetical protein